MTVRTAPTRQWADEGTRHLLGGLDELTDADLDRPCALPGWSRRHLLAHVASNAEALARLVSWARTGVPNPMYADTDQRARDIEHGSTRSDLREWVRESAAALDEALDGLTGDAWTAEVVTAQGRTVPATEIPWMRARETCVHAVDLGAGTTFADLPPGFLSTLLDDVARWRSARPGPALTLLTPQARHDVDGDGPPTTVELSLPGAAAWLVGRHADPDLPTLPNWI